MLAALPAVWAVKMALVKLVPIAAPQIKEPKAGTRGSLTPVALNVKSALPSLLMSQE